MGGRWGLPSAKRGRWATTWTSVCAAVARLGRFLSSSTSLHAASQSLAIALVRKFDQLDVIKQQSNREHRGINGLLEGPHFLMPAPLV
jgi:hypothetical protein